MSLWVAASGALAGLGVFAAAAAVLPGRARLDAALARIGGPGGTDTDQLPWHGIVRRLAAASWIAVPAADLAMLDADRERWVVTKLAAGLAGLGIVPGTAAVFVLTGHSLAPAVPALGSLAAGAGLFLLPDVLTRASAARRRTDFRHALASYLDLVALERGAGAGTTQALESAAAIGGGWAFERIGAALTAARQAGRPPWEGLADLAARTGVTELADVADIAELAGSEGARVLQTLAARAESMRAEALAATRARASARSTTMVVPIALLGAGFLLLLIFPIAYRTFG